MKRVSYVTVFFKFSVLFNNCNKIVSIYLSDEKWYMPREYYPDKYYPVFMAGGAYLMANCTNIIPKLIGAIDNYSSHVIFMDDLFITGIIAQKAGISRIRTPLINWNGCSNVCRFHKLIAGLSCENPDQTEKFWLEFKTKIC